MDRIKLIVADIERSVTHVGAYVLVLKDEISSRTLPITIGPFEAQSIMFQMDGYVPSRPLTHDLFMNTLTSFDIQLVEVEIYVEMGGVFRSHLVCQRNDELVNVDSRTSDAIALAIRCDAHIYTTSAILDKALNADSNAPFFQMEEEESIISLEELPTEELHNFMREAIEEEDYELAAEIKNILDTRKKN